MKVAIYSGVIPSTVFIENLISKLANNNMEVFLFGTKTGSYTPPSRNIRIFATPSNKYARFSFTLKYLCLATLWYPTRVRKLIKTIGPNLSVREKIIRLSKTLPVIVNLPDIFHIQWAKSAPEWIFLKEDFNVKIVLSLRGAHINYSPFCNEKLASLYRLVFPKIDGFHAVSEAIIEKAKLFGANGKNIQVIYSGVDTLETDNYLNEYGHDLDHSEIINILSIGRFHWIKGYKYAIDACKILKDRGINYKYIIIASGDSLEIQLQIKALSLENHIEIISGMTHDKVLQKISECDILLLPSIEEGIANVVLEAMALKKTVISTNCGGMAEAITHQENGILVKPMNTLAIVDGVIKLVNLPADDVRKMVDSGYNTIKEKFNLEGLGTNMINFYQETIENN